MNFFKRELIAGRVSLPGMGDYFMKGKQMKRVAVLLAASVLTAQCPVCPLKAQEKMTFMSENGFVGLEGSSSDYTIEFPEEPEIFNEFTSSFTEESKTSSEEITSTEESETSRKTKQPPQKSPKHPEKAQPPQKSPKHPAKLPQPPQKSPKH